MLTFKGLHKEFIEDTTREIDLEGSRNSGKTWACIAKIVKSCREHPGIEWLMCRHSATEMNNKLRPEFVKVARMLGVEVAWNDDEAAYWFPAVNGKISKVFAIGLQAQSRDRRFTKIRGTGVAAVWNDQTEEVDSDIGRELRFMLRQKDYPHQLLFSPNPPNNDFWLAREFPDDGTTLPGRKYYRLTLYDNAHNLTEEDIRGIEQAYPKTHPKYKALVLGQRSLAVHGEPIYGSDQENIVPSFQRVLHERKLPLDKTLPLLEAIDCEKHHPCIVWSQITPYGQLHALGGLFGQNLYLGDFLPIARRYRAEWFDGKYSRLLTCVGPSSGNNDGEEMLRSDSAMILQEHGFYPTWKAHSNSPDVRLAMIERMASYMRRRTPRGEAFGIEANPERWLRVESNRERHVSWPFLADGCEATYVWDPLMVSVASKQVRRARKDGWYEHGQTCLELTEYNFGGVQPSPDQLERRASKLAHKALVAAQRDDKDSWRWPRLKRTSRAGY